MISKEIEQVIQFGISSKKAGRVCDSCLFYVYMQGFLFFAKSLHASKLWFVIKK